MASYPDDDDGRVLADLAAHGVDMSQPLQIEFAVDVPDEEAAAQTQQALTAAGYDSQIVYDEGEPDDTGEIDPDDEEFGPSWTVYALVRMRPEYAEIMRIQADLDRLAGPFDGVSDGWGVMLEEEDEDA